MEYNQRFNSLETGGGGTSVTSAFQVQDPRITRMADVTTSFENTILDANLNAFVMGQDTPVPQKLVLPL